MLLIRKFTKKILI